MNSIEGKYSLFSIFKLALLEFKNQKSTLALYISSLAIGLFAYVGVDSFKTAVENELNSQSRAILAADMGLGSRQQIDQESIDIASKFLGDRLLAISSVTESFSMLTTDRQSKLVEIKAVDDNYPFYGSIELSNGTWSSQSPYIMPEFGAILYPETLTQLGLKIGDKFQLGGHEFTVSEKIISDPSSIGGGFNFAPTVYVSETDLKKTQLIQKGSTGFWTVLFKLQDNLNIDEIEEGLNQQLSNQSLRVLTPQKASQQVGRLLNYLSDYLSLASLVALFLTALGCAYLYKSYLQKNMKFIALYKILGIEKQDVRKLYLFHSLLLSLGAYIVVILLAVPLLPFLSGFGSELLNMDVTVRLEFTTAIISLLIACLGSILITYPLIRSIDQVDANKLITKQESEFKLHKSDLIYYTPLLLLFVLLSFILSKSYLTGAYFLSGVLLCAFILFISSWLLNYSLIKSPTTKNFTCKWLILSLQRNLQEFRFTYFSMSFGIILILLLPLLERSIQREIQSPDSTKTPSLFLFDIQKDQVDGLKQFLVNNNIQIQNESPMIRARLVKVNETDFKIEEQGQMTREQQEENRWRNRGYNLTYRIQLSDSERIIDGQMWTKASENPESSEISVESRFAQRIGLNMGDRLVFDVEGIPVNGTITSVRRIKWTSFQPNFFLQLQPNEFLTELPQTFVMSVKAPAELAIADLQNQLAKNFPSVSVIDVVRISERLTAIITQLSAALQLVGTTSLIVGLLIFFSMINQRAREKRKQANLLRVLGASKNTIYISILGEFLLLIFISLLSGVALSLIFNFILIKTVFDSLPDISGTNLLITSLTVFIIACSICFWGLRNSLNANPNELLREN